MTKSNTLNTRKQDKPNKNQNVFKVPMTLKTNKTFKHQNAPNAHKADTLKQSC